MRDDARQRIADAYRELQRLQCLFEDICWYNFECKVRRWKGPWLGKVQPGLTLCGRVVYTIERNGRARECGYFPVWYQGPTSTAPELPPEIIERELLAQQELIEELTTLLMDIDDYAPGGRAYVQLLASDPLSDLRTLPAADNLLTQT